MESSRLWFVWVHDVSCLVLELFMKVIFLLSFFLIFGFFISVSVSIYDKNWSPGICHGGNVIMFFSFSFSLSFFCCFLHMIRKFKVELLLWYVQFITCLVLHWTFSQLSWMLPSVWLFPSVCLNASSICTYAHNYIQSL